MQVCNVFHAGDGNLHPNIPYDATIPTSGARARAMREIMQACIDAGGTITGEHGVGLDKLPYMDRSSPTRRSARCARCATSSIRNGARIPARSCRCTAAASGTRRRRRADAARDDAVPLDSAAAVAATVRDARAARRRLRIIGARHWLDAGRPCTPTNELSLGALRGVIEYEPGDLTITARAGTPLAEIAR